MDEELFIKVSQYLKDKSQSNYKIAKCTGLSESTIGRYVKGDKPTLVNAKILLQYFENGAHVLSNAKVIDDIEFLNIPLIQIPAQGGYLKGYGDIEYVDGLPTFPVIVDKTYRGKYRVFEVSGDSMDDGSRESICDKDKILCREVKRELWANKLHIKDWLFVIVHRTEGITVKQITSHNVESGEIRCHPLNSIFDDFTLNLNDVVELYNVIKIVDRNTRL